MDSSKNEELLAANTNLVNAIKDLQERNNIKTRQKEGIKIALEKGKKFGRPILERPKNFEEEYKIWKEGRQTARKTMTNLNLKPTKFYMFVKEYEER